ncbi:hypothetical protein [Streptomyces olivoreticuli]|uniref:hypothetical protein n=1 Tax=Streptomyces olivoreticuli TaxID=68246 RepID=UPI000E26970E|nr:hypothetical protein [Streptomyces olivoreticuli]
MPKLKRTAAARSAGVAERVPTVPDLTGIDLRTLRHTEDPRLGAAVEEVLLDPGGFEEIWYSGGDDATGGRAPDRS